MNCNSEMLQTFLDQELDTDQASKLKGHLAECRQCRQELSRLKLLWMDLGNEEEIVIPPELSYLRQQAASMGQMLIKSPEASMSFWESQRLAWEPLALAMEIIPGTQAFGSAAKTVVNNVSAALGIIGKQSLKAIFRRRKS